MITDQIGWHNVLLPINQLTILLQFPTKVKVSFEEVLLLHVIVKILNSHCRLNLHNLSDKSVSWIGYYSDCNQCWWI